MTDDLAAATGWIPAPTFQFGVAAQSHPAQGKQVSIGKILLKPAPNPDRCRPSTTTVESPFRQSQRDENSLEYNNGGASAAMTCDFRDIEEI